ncbi:MAG TPA: FAD-binding oxidoreductase, partial [Magnetococcales bacterium]|nr:FAD-binding oxidoreductase [Magnetococcales bacterium]
MRPGAAIPDSARQDLERLLGVDRFLTAGVDREAYAWDNTGHRVLPDAVALVTTEDEVCGVLRLCQAYRIPVTPRGAGTGNVGGCLAVFGGVVLSTQQMNRILEVSVAD